MIVVDCSIVVDALLSEYADDLRGLLATHRLAAPHLIDFEMVVAVRSLVLGNRISSPRGEEILADYDLLQVTRWNSADDLRRRSFDLRDNISAYDAAYVSLAESLRCSLVTRDRRLAKAAAELVHVIVA